MAVASVPARDPGGRRCTPTGFVRDGINLTAAQIGGTVTGDARRDRLRHRCLQPDQRQRRRHPRRALLRRRRQRRRTVNVTNSKVHEHRRRPVQRHAARPCHHLYQRRERHDQRQPGLRLPEERDRGHQPDRRWQRSLQRQDLRDGPEERRHRRGSHRLHRPERHRDQGRRERHREEQHRQRLQLHAGRTPRPRACCSIRTRPARVTASAQQVRRQRGEHRTA